MCTTGDLYRILHHCRIYGVLWKPWEYTGFEVAVEIEEGRSIIKQRDAKSMLHVGAGDSTRINALLRFRFSKGFFLSAGI